MPRTDYPIYRRRICRGSNIFLSFFYLSLDGISFITAVSRYFFATFFISGKIALIRVDNIQQKFREQSIDGTSLPLLTEDHLTVYMGMRLGPALKLRTTLAKMTGRCTVCMHCIHCHGEENDRRSTFSASPVSTPAAPATAPSAAGSSAAGPPPAPGTPVAASTSPAPASATPPRASPAPAHSPASSNPGVAYALVSRSRVVVRACAEDIEVDTHACIDVVVFYATSNDKVTPTVDVQHTVTPWQGGISGRHNNGGSFIVCHRKWELAVESYTTALVLVGENGPSVDDKK
ncbi:hypothetical protein HPB51_021245 [Rhipicephalus microplus]|uniref:SAM domain-containing protein n=1 Tax=Rhipicephalus microplus TaxID=6941 RepID=A0A9J6F7G4_RHIMP|nr:hypothetical protein HPB51_021245 [Rhipicephalus microplus]